MNIINFIRGFCMALADSVPGVSGGTIAFLLGFYDDFISSLNSLISGNKNERIDSIKFLIKLGAGWIVGFILSMLFLGSVFEDQIYKISSLFIGFIIFAIPLIIAEEKESLKKNYKNIIWLIVGITIVGCITYFNSKLGGGFTRSLDSLNIGLVIYIFVAGMVAISAMVLPGISGSTLLLIFGLYVPIVNAIKETLTFNLTYVPVLIIFGLGVIAGIVFTIRGVKYLLANYRGQIIYTIIGLMIGSVYAVIMGPSSLEVPKAPLDMESFSILFFVVGGALILGLQKLKVSFDK